MASLTIPAGYDIAELSDGFAVIELYAGGFGRSVIERGFPCEAEAIHWAQDLAAEAQDDACESDAAAAEYGAYDVQRAA